MGMIVLGLVKDAHQARGLVRALEDDGFELDDIDVDAGPLTELVARGVPEEEAHFYAEGARRGGMLVCVRAADEEAAAEAAEMMASHGAVDIEECSTAWRNAGWGGRYEPALVDEYALAFGEYPSAPGRIYHDPRSAYAGPERRARDEPYAGPDRRAI